MGGEQERKNTRRNALSVMCKLFNVPAILLQRFMLTLHFSAHRPLFKSGR